MPEMFEIAPTPITGLLSIDPIVRDDIRGNFAKLLHKEYFENLKLPFDCNESYISSSRRGVLRGMHFQTPPHDHDKIVYCVDGAVLDVIVDLRRDSPTFRASFSRELSGSKYQGMLVPRGCAHGFLTTSENAQMLYYVSTSYSPEHDTGIHWNSFGYEWPIDKPLVSERDKSFVELSSFTTPFQ